MNFHSLPFSFSQNHGWKMWLLLDVEKWTNTHSGNPDISGKNFAFHIHCGENHVGIDIDTGFSASIAQVRTYKDGDEQKLVLIQTVIYCQQQPPILLTFVDSTQSFLYNNFNHAKSSQTSHHHPFWVKVSFFPSQPFQVSLFEETKAIISWGYIQC